MARDDCDVNSMHSVNHQPCRNVTPNNNTGNNKQFTRKRLKVEKTLTGMMNLEVTAREQVWLREFRQGSTTDAIAYRDGVSVRCVRLGMSRASAHERRQSDKIRDRLPWLVPLFPIGPYTPRSMCGHRKPIVSGSDLCCMICHRSGWDEHPAMQRDPETEPAPEPRHTSPFHDLLRETRRGRRLRLFGSRNQCS
jgi:hypothetical protein